MNDKGIGAAGLGLMLAAGLVASTVIATRSFERVKRADQTIAVKGYAERKIASDFASWTGTFRAQAPKLVTAYERVQQERLAVADWLEKAGVAKDLARFSSVETAVVRKRDAHGNETAEVEAYRLSQSVVIEGGDIALAQRIAQQVTDLIQQGVEFESAKPVFLYTQLNELKLKLLSEATRDARLRAEQVAQAGGGKVGALRAAEQGVFQITSAHSTEVSGSGEYDTESPDKVVKAVVTVVYLVD